MYVATTAVQKLLKLRKRIRAIPGGTSASKTISIEQILIDKAQSSNKLISITSESMPHLKRGAMRDFLNIMEQHGYFKEASWNRSDYIYTFETGSKIEFFSLDMPHKVRGPRRDILFINEANNIARETFDQLEVRTKDEIWLDWNPTNEFWAYELLEERDDIEMCTLTYKDNEGLPESIVKSIESRKNNKNWWAVYGMGQLGDVEGKIYKNWPVLDEIPEGARLTRRGLDFGYSNDPAALVDIYEYEHGYILSQRLYRKGMSNKAIADYINGLEDPQTLVIADSAEPKSIDELESYGIVVLPAQKGPGSITQGIQYMQDKKIWITKASLDGIKENRNYMWQTDRNGKIINVPEGGNDHFLDAARYGMENLKPKPTVSFKKPAIMLARKRAHRISM